MINNQLSIAMALVFCAATAQADWTTLRGNVQRTGFVQTELNPPFHIAWACHFAGERLGTAMEPIIADDKLFVATHNGNVYALDARSGQAIWRFQAYGAFLHSPAFADNTVVAGSADGSLYALESLTGKLKWSLYTNGGFSASPAIVNENVFIGTRAGDFLGVDLKSGKILWKNQFGVPIRQTASFADGRVFVTAEDLRVRCLDARTGELLWTSEPLIGQTARDYYPVIAKVNGRAFKLWESLSKKTFVIVRTNPVINMAQRIGQDRHVLCQSAGADDSGWQELDKWIKSEQARDNPDLWSKEQSAVVQYLRQHPEARTFFVLDAQTGKETDIAPVFWCDGCQGVGTPPVAMPDGRLQVFYRSAYGNWNLGVAPLVSLGFLNLAQNRIDPLAHINGNQPPWNTFWGTADESQNFIIAGNTLLIIHQSTLSGFDLISNRLFPIAGNRDSWGGFRNLPWARNEWHGPARGGAAVVGDRIYWLTGSRILCISSGEQEAPPMDIEINGQDVQSEISGESSPQIPDREQLLKLLEEKVTEFMSQRWAPLCVEPGLAGRELFFDNSGDVFEALAWAFPHLPSHLQRQVKSFLADEWEKHPPFTKEAWYDPEEGKRREYFDMLPTELSRLHNELIHHPFGNLYAVWLYAERCSEWGRVLKEWQSIRTCFDDFTKMNWKLDADRGSLFANCYLASLLAFAQIAEQTKDDESARKAKTTAEQTKEALIAWWLRSVENITPPVFQDISQWDRFIGSGDNIFFRIIPHNSKLALFHKLTPEVAEIIKTRVDHDRLWQAFEALCCTWYLAGEERQVHYGENYVDPPDFAMDAFRAMAWLQNTRSVSELAARLDIPFCRADLNYITKIAIILERSSLHNKMQ